MCRDHEVLRFCFDLVSHRLKGKATMLDARYLPIDCLDHSRKFASPRLVRWLANRAVADIPSRLEGIRAALERNVDEVREVRRKLSAWPRIPSTLQGIGHRKAHEPRRVKRKLV